MTTARIVLDKHEYRVLRAAVRQSTFKPQHNSIDACMDLCAYGLLERDDEGLYRATAAGEKLIEEMEPAL